jgi:hypothetical protein
MTIRCLVDSTVSRYDQMPVAVSPSTVISGWVAV